jgi:hypothetical protein
MLAIRSLGAIGAIGPLLSLLEKAEGIQPELRGEALFTLRHWLSRGPEQLAMLHDRKSKEGLLRSRGYSNAEAQIIADLLFAIPLAERQEKETFAVLIEYLRHKKMLVRTLAHSHLSFLVPFEKIAYNPAGSAEEREKGHEAWKKLLDAGKLPPAPK